MPQERIEKGKRVRACTICGRTFKRTEHCIRHERAHFRERPFSCRFCDKSYGRKDLLVRHERTLHADEWAHAQSTASPNLPARPDRRRQNRDSLSHAHPLPHSLPQPLPRAEPQLKEESHAGMRINDETVIQYESFLPSPRVSSSSEISDPELVTGVSDGMEVEFPLDPSLSNGFHLAVAGGIENAPHGFIPAYSVDQPHVAYGSQLQQHESQHFNTYQGLPIDPNLTTDGPQIDNLPILQEDIFPKAENVNVFALFPDMTLDSQTLTNYLDGLFGDKTTLDLFKDTPTDDIISSSMPPPGSRRRGRPSHDVKAQSSPCRRKVFTEECRLDLLTNLGDKFDCDVQETRIPNVQTIQRFLNQFFQSFNNRLPIFHLPSIDITTTPTPLILAMCSIGALFASEKDAANDLREISKQALQNRESVSDRPLWEVQCKLLLIVQAAFGGDCNAVNWALESMGFFHREFSSRRAALSATRDVKLNNNSWSVWIERESSKRLLFGMFIISSLLTLSYNMAPCISTTEDLKIEMPAEESAWMAPDESCWKKAMAAKVSPNMDIYQALTRVLFGKDFDPDSESQWPAFGVAILMHAINVHMWHVTQSTQSFMNFSADAKIEEQMKSLCTSQTEGALVRCYMIFARRHPYDRDKIWDDVEGPLLFNGMAVLRSCYVRAFTGSGSFNRSILFSNDEEAIFRAARDYMQIEQVRTPFLTAAVAQTLAGLLAPLQAVHAHSEKKATLAWSVEHVIAVWDCALFYTKWVHTMETQQEFAQPGAEEKHNLETLLEVLKSSDQREKVSQSLAASAARLWADLIDNNSTWEVTRRMGKVLRKLAVVYEINKDMP